jgi:hypothetical protein
LIFVDHFFSVDTDAYEDSKAKAITGSGLEKVKRLDRRVTSGLAECLAQNLQWR